MAKPTSERRVWSDDAKLEILAEVENGRAVAEVGRQYGVNASTIYYWKNHFENRAPTEAKATPPLPGKIADAAVARRKAKKARAKYKNLPAERVAVTPAARPADVVVGELKPHPRGLSYEQLVDENARLHAALMALLRSPSR